jgi:hypothetical protein
MSGVAFQPKRLQGKNMNPDYRELVQQLLSDDAEQKISAQKTLLALEEDAVTGLLDEYYAGVNEAQGLAILDILAQIGGYEALNALRSLLFFDLSTPAALRIAAAQGLLQNSDNLSPDEIQKVTAYLNHQS